MRRRIVYSRHASEMLEERRISADWVVRTIESPTIIDTDPQRPDRKRAFLAISENDDRILRVVYVEDRDEIRVITTFFDQGRRHVAAH